MATLDGDRTGNSLTGTDGRDQIEGHEGTNTIPGGAGDDTIDGGSQGATIFGGDGNDALTGGSGDDQLLGAAGDDAIDSTCNNATIFGGAGNDTIRTRFGTAHVDGGAGDDQIWPDGHSGTPNTWPSALARQRPYARLRSRARFRPYRRSQPGRHRHHPDRGPPDLDAEHRGRRPGRPHGAGPVLFLEPCRHRRPDPDPPGRVRQLQAAPGPSLPCFAAGSRIATPNGPRRIDRLRPGDLVATRDNGPRPVGRLLRRRVVPREMAAARDGGQCRAMPGADRGRRAGAGAAGPGHVAVAPARGADAGARRARGDCAHPPSGQETGSGPPEARPAQDPAAVSASASASEPRHA
ncbi:Hint domain-containing protein [Rhodovulum visakhapatnamense]|uniref:Hint domain-containing protein n=1 Tax=Rhodovulum visakhapatnamense TaxID=364297 RepID=A0ABS1RLW2_9RHOB|nr:Hint domain-containing protein [Rhodovulum visakhapatnamense]MBL3580653.1 Hint domain-containing protein [Rhodovulum visakhapatnamense]